MSEELKAGHPPAGLIHIYYPNRKVRNVIKFLYLILLSSEGWWNASGDQAQTFREGRC